MGATATAELDKAAKDLDAAAEAAKGTATPTLLERLAKGIDDLQAGVKSLLKGDDPGKDGDPNEEEDDEVILSGKRVKKPKEGTRVGQGENARVRGGDADSADKSRSGDVEDLVRSEITPDEERVQAVDATPVLHDMTEAIVKGFGALADHQQADRTALEGRITRLESALGQTMKSLAVILESQAEMQKSVAAMPVRPSAPGVMGTVQGKDVLLKTDAPAGTPMLKAQSGLVEEKGDYERSQIAMRLHKAVQDRKLDPAHLLRHDTPRWREYLNLVPQDVATTYDIPRFEAA